MKLSQALAREIANKARAILDREIMVTDTEGRLLTGKGTKGQFISDASRACQEGRQIKGTLGAHQVEWCPFVYEEQTMGVFGIVLESSQITPEAIMLLQGLAEVIVHQHYLLERVQSTETVRSEFIKELLQASHIDPDAIYRQADILQLNLRSPQAVIATMVSGFESALHSKTSHLTNEEQRLELARSTERVSSRIRQAFRNYQDNVIAYIGDDTFVVLKGIGGPNPNTVNSIRFLSEKGSYIYELFKNLYSDLPVTVGVGQFYPDLGGLRKSYQDASLALNVGSKVWGQDRVYHIKQVGMFVTLANISQDRKAELAYQILHPLLRDQQLFKTVRIFLEAGLNLTEAAELLHIHRNTLIYRLDKTKRLISLDPRHFDDALQIKLGLMFYQSA